MTLTELKVLKKMVLKMKVAEQEENLPAPITTEDAKIICDMEMLLIGLIEFIELHDEENL